MNEISPIQKSTSNKKRSDKGTDEISLTICIITFNRGKRVLENIPHYLNKLGSECQILILDNASVKEPEAYRAVLDKTKNISSLKYLRKNSNNQMRGNFFDCFVYSNTDYVMVLSDEDIPNNNEIKEAIIFLKNNPNIGVFKGSMTPMPSVPSKNSIINESKIYEKGYDAITSFGIWNNYISGTIYNTKIFKKCNLKDIFQKNLYKQIYYPHVYLEILMSAISDAAYSPKILVFEGEEIIDTDPEEVDQFQVQQSVGSRLDQFIALRDGLREATKLIKADFCHDTFFNAYFHLCLKYFDILMNPNLTLHEKQYMDKNYLKGSFYFLCLSAVKHYDQSQSYLKELGQLLKKVRNNY